MLLTQDDTRKENDPSFKLKKKILSGSAFNYYKKKLLKFGFDFIFTKSE